MNERPAALTDDMLEFLDALRDSGEMNMYGAAPYIAKAYGIDKRDARAVLAYWMATFADRHPN